MESWRLFGDEHEHGFGKQCWQTDNFDLYNFSGTHLLGRLFSKRLFPFQLSFFSSLFGTYNQAFPLAAFVGFLWAVLCFSRLYCSVPLQFYTSWESESLKTLEERHAHSHFSSPFIMIHMLREPGAFQAKSEVI